MKQRLLAVALSLGLIGTTLPAPVRAKDGLGAGNTTKHVLLISIDGMHAVDYENCVASNTCPTLAALGKTGVNYTRTTTSRPSDSFPGLLALVTGGSPRTVGGFYDVAYDRVLAPPKMATGNGLPSGPCHLNVINGTQTEYEEGDEIDQTQLNGGFPGYSKIDGGVKSINPDKLVRDPFNNCQPVYPWNFIRTNTIYGVIHAAGGYTAWSDKHAVYALVSGPTGTDQPSNVDDYYSPEVNSNKIPLPGLTTAGTNYNCANVVMDGNDWTTDFDAIKCYDQLKVNAVVNEINGKNHLGTSKAPVPVVLGMNFQAVSVGEKLVSPAALPAARSDSNSGGYEDAQGTPRPLMMKEIVFADAAIGQMVSALKKEGLLDSTTIIVTAKHGQSPIDPNRFFPIPGKTNNGEPPSAALLPPNPNLLPAVYSDPTNGLGLAEDDISQIWLADASTTTAAVTALENASTAIGLGQIYYGASLNTLFNPPGVPNVPGPCCKLREGGDPRSPDIVVIPNVGVVYTGGDKKQSEHGGYAWDDTNVMLLVANPHLRPKTLHSFVETAQVAPTILQLLGLDPDALDAVRAEGTPVLPGLD
ncbi:MAG TPA: alkaline phosphatase family protein [Candidatus Cybelea sp.]|nr:alkaline phosphatase family protein [Candidatus Cybelea sp.]